jgi:hypothetical protein
MHNLPVPLTCVFPPPKITRLCGIPMSRSTKRSLTIALKNYFMLGQMGVVYKAEQTMLVRRERMCEHEGDD